MFIECRCSDAVILVSLYDKSLSFGSITTIPSLFSAGEFIRTCLRHVLINCPYTLLNLGWVIDRVDRLAFVFPIRREQC